LQKMPGSQPHSSALANCATLRDILIVKLNNFHLKIIGIVLYWTEGSKQKVHDPSKELIFSNSDPKMIRIYLLWLKKCLLIKPSGIKFEIYIHETYKKTPKELSLYWSRITKFPIQNLNKIYFKKNKVNFGETGFFRTAYSKELLEKLREPIKNKKLSARDRLGIIRDLFALAESGDIPTTDALEFLSAYKKEDNYTVWVEIATGLARLEQLLIKSNVQNNLNALIVDLFSPTFKRLG